MALADRMNWADKVRRMRAMRINPQAGVQGMNQMTGDYGRDGGYMADTGRDGGPSASYRTNRYTGDYGGDGGPQANFTGDVGTDGGPRANFTGDTGTDGGPQAHFTGDVGMDGGPQAHFTGDTGSDGGPAAAPALDWADRIRQRRALMQGTQAQNLATGDVGTYGGPGNQMPMAAAPQAPMAPLTRAPIQFGAPQARSQNQMDDYQARLAQMAAARRQPARPYAP